MQGLLLFDQQKKWQHNGIQKDFNDSGMGNGTEIPWDLCSGQESRDLGEIGTDFLGTLGNGTNIAGTVPGQKSHLLTIIYAMEMLLVLLTRELQAVTFS